MNQPALNRFAHTWRALTHRNFRLFFLGQGLSLIGTWITRIATAWLVYRLTGSALMLGLVGFSGQIFAFLLGPLAGAIVDRYDRRNLLLLAQILASLQSAALAVLTLTHRITVPQLIALSLVQGLIDSFDFPARQSFFSDLISDKQALGNAIALNSILVNGSRLVGPALAGFLIAWRGEGVCFAIDAVSYLPILLALTLIRVPAAKHAPQHLLTEIRDGWTYVSTHPTIRVLLALFALTSLLGMAFLTLMPIVATTLLHGGPSLLGTLMSASGVGALLSAFSLAARRSIRGLPAMIRAATFLLAAGLLTLGLSTAVWLSLLAMAVLGFATLQSVAAGNTIIQTLVPESTRGRVMSYFNMAVVGISPFGSLLAGALGQRLGTPHTLLATGLATLLIALWFTRHVPAIHTASD